MYTRTYVCMFECMYVRTSNTPQLTLHYIYVDTYSHATEITLHSSDILYMRTYIRTYTHTRNLWF